MYDYLRRSDTVIHQASRETNFRSKSLEGYVPADREKKKGNIPKQKMHMENSFGSLALGVDSRGNMIFVASGKKDFSQTPVPEAAKKLDGSRAVEKEQGVFMDNASNPCSAVAYKESIRSPKEREGMLTRIKQSLEDEKTHTGRMNETVMGQMPFLNLKHDRENLKALEKISGNENLSERIKEHQAQALRQEIRIKQQIRREVLRGIREALKEPFRKEDDWPRRFFTGLLEEILSDGSSDDSGNGTGEAADWTWHKLGDGSAED